MRKFILIPFCFAVAACGTSDPENHPCLRRAASAEIAVTRSLDTVTDLYVSEVIDTETAGDALLVIKGANSAVDSGGRLCLVDEAQAQDYLNEAFTLVQEVNRILGDAE